MNQQVKIYQIYILEIIKLIKKCRKISNFYHRSNIGNKNLKNA